MEIISSVKMEIAFAVSLEIMLYDYFFYSREWYSYHFPELVKLVPDNYSFAQVASFIEDRKQFGEDKLEGLEEIVMDSVKAQSIVEAARMSMGKLCKT